MRKFVSFKGFALLWLISSLATEVRSETPRSATAVGSGSGSDSDVAPLEKKELPGPLAKRRPSVDAGLRYSSRDWLVNFILIPKSFIIKRIGFHLFSNVLICIATILLYERFPNIAIPMTGHSLLASPLGLLLSYRTDSAYGRFWEARGHWTNTKTICRHIAVMVKTHIEPYSPKASAKFLDQLAAYPATLMHLCLGGAAKLPDHAQKYIPENSEKFDFQAQPAWPAMLMCMELQKTLHDADQESEMIKWNLVEAANHNYIAQQIDLLLDNMSNCEKILRTPVPWSYSRHTSRFLTLWLMTLPLALLGTMKSWLVLPTVIAAGYCMLGIEEIGHLIEQPFLGDPLEAESSSDFKIYVSLDEDGEASELVTRGQATLPYDIGIPVCSLAMQIRKEVEGIARSKGSRPNPRDR